MLRDFYRKEYQEMTVVVIIALVLGTSTSLIIGIVQAYLPERSSQLMDVSTNIGGPQWAFTFGTYLCVDFRRFRRAGYQH